MDSSLCLLFTPLFSFLTCAPSLPRTDLLTDSVRRAFPHVGRSSSSRSRSRKASGLPPTEVFALPPTEVFALATPKNPIDRGVQKQCHVVELLTEAAHQAKLAVNALYTPSLMLTSLL
jgi:hypothetical protein